MIGDKFITSFFNSKDLRLEDLDLDGKKHRVVHDDIIRYYLSGPHNLALPPLHTIRKL